MKKNQSKGNGWRIGGFIGVLLLSAFCCGGPALFAALGGLGIGAIFAGASGLWWIFGILIAMAIVVTAVVIRRKRKHADVNAIDSRGKKANREDCCAPIKINGYKHETK